MASWIRIRIRIQSSWIRIRIQEKRGGFGFSWIRIRGAWIRIRIRIRDARIRTSLFGTRKYSSSFLGMSNSQIYLESNDRLVQC